MTFECDKYTFYTGYKGDDEPFKVSQLPVALIVKDNDPVEISEASSTQDISESDFFWR